MYLYLIGAMHYRFVCSAINVTLSLKLCVTKTIMPKSFSSIKGTPIDVVEPPDLK